MIYDFYDARFAATNNLDHSAIADVARREQQHAIWSPRACKPAAGTIIKVSPIEALPTFLHGFLFEDVEVSHEKSCGDTRAP